MLPRLRHQVDVLIFNPPYVITSAEEIHEGELLTKSWAGGESGREVMDKLAPVVPELLSQTGSYFLVATRENKPDEICKSMSKRGLRSEVVLSRRCGAEFLSVLRFRREGSESEEGL